MDNETIKQFEHINQQISMAFQGFSKALESLVPVFAEFAKSFAWLQTMPPIPQYIQDRSLIACELMTWGVPERAAEFISQRIPKRFAAVIAGMLERDKEA